MNNGRRDGTCLTWAVHGTGGWITVLNGAPAPAGAGAQQRVFVAHMQSSDLGERGDAARPWG